MSVVSIELAGSFRRKLTSRALVHRCTCMSGHLENSAGGSTAALSQTALTSGSTSRASHFSREWALSRCEPPRVQCTICMLVHLKNHPYSLLGINLPLFFSMVLPLQCTWGMWTTVSLRRSKLSCSVLTAMPCFMGDGTRIRLEASIWVTACQLGRCAPREW